MAKRPPEATGFAQATEGEKLFAPTAARNQPAINAVMARIAPQSGKALEIASGTGQHIVGFAEMRPNILWQPTDVAPDRLASINAYREDSDLENILAAHVLNATQAGWAEANGPFDLIYLSNLLHLISEEAAKTLITEASAALNPGGVALIYGPFMRGGELSSAGDKDFHAKLTAQDPEIGYKDIQAVITWATKMGLHHVKTHEMPANNLAIHLAKPKASMR